MSISTLNLKVAAEKGIQAAAKEIAKITDFAYSFNELETAKGSAIRVPVFNVGPAGEFDADSNNYCGKTTSVEGVDVNVDTHLVRSEYWNDRDTVECDVNFMEGLGEGIGKSLARGVVAKTIALLNSVNITQKETVKAASFDKKDILANLTATCFKYNLTPSETVLILTPAAYAKVLGTLDADIYGGASAIQNGIVEGLYGFKSVLRVDALPEGANGVLIHSQALGIAGRVVPAMASAYEDTGVTRDPNTGLAFGWRVYAQPETGRRFVAGDALFGVKLIQPKAAVRLTEE